MLLRTIGTSAWQNSFDFGVEEFLNHFAHKSPAFDWVMNTAATSLFFCGGALMLIAWYVLFDKKQPRRLREGSELLVCTIAGSSIAALVVRIVAHLIPFRLRPMATPGLHFVPPVDGFQSLNAWSSFPSDHAMVFFLAATGIFFVSRKAGSLAYLLVALLVCLPRLYLGFHWPTDILVGALVGTGFGWATKIPPFHRLMRELIFSWYAKQPGSFLAAMFFFTFQLGTTFQDANNIFATSLKHLG